MSKLNKAIWAECLDDKLVSVQGVQPLKMHQSDGTALPLVLDDSEERNFGADLIRFASSEGVSLHTHVGAHILLVTKGTGVLTYSGEKYELFPGMIYLVPSNVPHVIHATTELVLVAIGNDHRPADSSERLELIDKEKRDE